MIVLDAGLIFKLLIYCELHFKESITQSQLTALWLLIHYNFFSWRRLYWISWTKSKALWGTRISQVNFYYKHQSSVCIHACINARFLGWGWEWFWNERTEKVEWKGIKSNTSYNAVLQRKNSSFESLLRFIVYFYTFPSDYINSLSILYLSFSDFSTVITMSLPETLVNI